MTAKTKAKPKLNTNARKWVKALRSGKYKQGRACLAKVNGQTQYCCLGVACDLYQKNVGNLRVTEVGNRRRYDGTDAFLPRKVQRWLGVATSRGQFRDEIGEANFLDALNDGGKRFATIAKVIESKPPGLFKS